MVGLKPFSRAWEFMLHVDGVACDDGNENGFIELSTGDDVKHQDSLFVSSKSASESDQIWTVKDITGLKIFKNTLKAFDAFKDNQKSVWSNVFWCLKVCIFWKFTQAIIHWVKTNI